MRGPLGGQFGVETPKLSARRPCRVADGHDRRVGTVPGHRPRLQNFEQLVRVGDPELSEAAQVGPVGAGSVPGALGGGPLRGGGDPLRSRPGSPQ